MKRWMAHHMPYIGNTAGCKELINGNRAQQLGVLLLQPPPEPINGEQLQPPREQDVHTTSNLLMHAWMHVRAQMAMHVPRSESCFPSIDSKEGH